MRRTAVWALVVAADYRFGEQKRCQHARSDRARANSARGGRRRPVDGPFVETKEWVLCQNPPTQRRLSATMSPPLGDAAKRHWL